MERQGGLGIRVDTLTQSDTRRNKLTETGFWHMELNFPRFHNPYYARTYRNMVKLFSSYVIIPYAIMLIPQTLELHSLTPVVHQFETNIRFFVVCVRLVFH